MGMYREKGSPDLVCMINRKCSTTTHNQNCRIIINFQVNKDRVDADFILVFVKTKHKKVKFTAEKIPFRLEMCGCSPPLS